MLRPIAAMKCLFLIAVPCAASFSAAGNANAQQQHAQPHHAVRAMTNLQTPSSIAVEHRELHETLKKASGEKGALGAAALALEAALAPHFRREEEIATPPLGLLPLLARDGASPEMRRVLQMTSALERELPQMLREHEAIRAAAARFRAAAERERRADYVHFVDQLAAHAREEEEILYPAAILVGRYIVAATPAAK